MSVQKSDRLYYWDYLRAGLMLLGIPYHTALAYTYDGWTITSPEKSRFLSYFADTVHLFRMPAFFVIAGYFAAILLNRKPRSDWFKSRLMRLGVPLISAAIILNPLQGLFENISPIGEAGNPFSEDIMAFAKHMMSSSSAWIRHLWFLIALIYFSALAAFIPRNNLVFSAISNAFSHIISIKNIYFLIFVICSAICAYELFSHAIVRRLPSFLGLDFSIFQLERSVIYAPYFVLGYLLGRTADFYAQFTQVRPLLTIAAVASLGVGLFLCANKEWTYLRAFSAFPAILTCQVLISLARNFVFKENYLISKLSSASFAIYLFHQPIIVALDFFMMPISILPILKFIIISLSTFTFSYFIHLIVCRSKILSFLFNGIRRKSETELSTRSNIARLTV